jgi:hypothetical protein
MVLECKMATINKSNIRLWKIFLESFSAGVAKDLVILSPYSKEGRLASAEVLVKGRIEGDVGLVWDSMLEISKGEY